MKSQFSVAVAVFTIGKEKGTLIKQIWQMITDFIKICTNPNDPRYPCSLKTATENYLFIFSST
jgi:hypothetical protein